MKRFSLPPRPDWQDKAEAAGFTFHTMYGAPYWAEDTAYAFTLAQIENDIEDPTTALHAMVRQAVDHIITSEALMARMGLPFAYWDYIANSWRAGEPELYGRMDLAYDGRGPAKLLEYNADTPTSLFESASFQWDWLQDQLELGHLPAGTDQFNRIFEAIAERFEAVFPAGTDIHFASVADNTEDYGTVETLAWAAREAGLGAHYTTMDSIGLTENGQFADSQSRVMGVLFKLYPWENLLAEPFAEHLPTAHLRLIEPPWKALVSNKAILPVLWQLFPDHPNLLPAYFADDWSDAPVDLPHGIVRKPLFSREGASVTILGPNGETIARAEDRSYDQYPEIVQAYHPLPVFDGYRPVLGAWVAGETCVGLGLREDQSPITQNLSRFVPHVIQD
ncbi:glutathionylspermidine synthase [Ketogulonicigenium robustum]|uniref:Glutathionylspermidine synthase n=1 Tax=Ketogulonicigenium robustum TaxID=92947 RepID=A0A1W6P245_9RHOB|nr:glutathionylspermidine synthase family protein [Ketogulonicigenium robustum]ARO15461.1 glutathionylspermidine synthase [Ketogulonicigenium robustum]